MEPESESESIAVNDDGNGDEDAQKKDMTMGVVDEKASKDSLENRTFRRLGWRILPIFAVYDAVASLEKSSLSYAAAGLRETTGISESQYGLAGTVFIATYAASTIPTVLAAQRVGAARGLFVMMFCFGIVTVCTAAVTNEAGLLANRVALGITEAGVIQTVLYYMSQFYGPERLALSFSKSMGVGGSVAKTIGPLLAGGILAIGRTQSALHPWQLLFIIEGLPCFIVSFVVLFYLPNSPMQCSSFLNPEENAYLVDYAEKNQERKKRVSAELASDDISFWRVLIDPRVLLLSASLFCWDVALWGMIFWLPTVLRTDGRSDITVALLAAIPNFAGMCAGLLASWSSDRRRERVLHGVFGDLLAALGLALTGIFMAVPDFPGTSWFQLATLTIAQVGSSIFYPCFIALQGDIMPKHAAASGFAIVKALGVSGGIIGPYMLGALKESTGSFILPMYILSGFYVLGALVFLQTRRVIRKMTKVDLVLSDDDTDIEGKEEEGDPKAASL